MVALSLAVVFFAGYRLNAIDAYNQQVEETGQGTINTSSPIYAILRLVALIELGIYVIYAVVKLLAPKRRKPNRSIWGDIGIYLMLAIVAVAMVFPLVFSVCSALKPLDELFRFPPRVFPQRVTLDNFSDLIVTMGQSWVPFMRYLTNTVFITLVGTFGHVIIASMAAFVLAKYDFPGGRTFFSMVVTALMFSGYVTGIPNYIIMSRLRMIDTYWAVILPAFAAPVGLFLMKQFMEGLPTSLIEAAHLDGAGEFRIFWNIVMPNVKPAWLTIIIFSVQNLWNTNAATVIYSEEKKTLVYALQQIQAGGIARTGQAAAVTVIVMLVPVTIFILSQSRILETMASSGLKD
uniref:Sugar ABC transporter permease protein n=1 Tax=uncultured bacterium Ad_010_C07 TaxID=1489291 RepID=A0A0B4N0J5_9BACT|nr:sugar ABC transporter permease protein [uncultured bacterium Ad_010_C07]